MGNIKENKETQEKVDLWDPALDLFISNKVHADVASAEDVTELDMIQFAYKSLNRIVISGLRSRKTGELSAYEKRLLKDGSTRFYHESVHSISAKRRELLKKKGGAKDRINTMDRINNMYSMLEHRLKDDPKRRKDDTYSGWLRR